MSVIVSAIQVKWFLKQMCTNKLFVVDTSNFRVGRCPTAQVILNSNKTSRTHSSFLVNVEGHLFIQDLKSVNGTFVNGQQIEVYVQHRVFPGDIVSFGLAHEKLAENEKDRNTFFEVLMEVPKPLEPVEIDLVDSTTGISENKPVAIIDLVETPSNENIDSSTNSQIGLHSSILETPKEFLNNLFGSSPRSLNLGDSVKSDKFQYKTSVDLGENQDVSKLTVSGMKEFKGESKTNVITDGSLELNNECEENVFYINDSDSEISLDNISKERNTTSNLSNVCSDVLSRNITTDNSNSPSTDFNKGKHESTDFISEYKELKYALNNSFLAKQVINCQNASSDLKNSGKNYNDNNLRRKSDTSVDLKSKNKIFKDAKTMQQNKMPLKLKNNLLTDKESSDSSLLNKIKNKGKCMIEKLGTTENKTNVNMPDIEKVEENVLDEVLLVSLVKSNTNKINNQMKVNFEDNCNLSRNEEVDHKRSSENLLSSPIGSSNNSNINKSDRSFSNSFSTCKDASIVIDVTDDDDDDFSCSQIFQMSEKVKTVEQDDNFQKIKRELAEMDFCNDEIILNQVPVDLENDFENSGFENTQEMCDYLEDDLDNIQENAIEPDISSKSKDTENNCYLTSKELMVGPSKDDCHKLDIKKNNIVDESHRNKKSNKKSPGKLSVKVDTKASNKCAMVKRKNSLEESKNKKKIKASITTPGLLSKCDSKSIQSELKKRHSGSGLEIDKSTKSAIREERRKKLKQLEESNAKNKIAKKVCDNISTVKVMPQATTNRGSFLCEEPSLVKVAIQNKSPTYKLKPIDLPKLPPLTRISDTTPSNSFGGNTKGRYNLRHSSGNNVVQTAHHISSTTSNRGQSLPQSSIETTSKATKSSDMNFKTPATTRNTNLQRSNSNYSTISTIETLSSRLMYPNVPTATLKNTSNRHLINYSTDDIVHKIVHWSPNWLVEQVDIDISPPINDPPASKIPLNFRDFNHYYDTFYKMVLLEKWHYLFKGFRESKEQPRKAQITHVRVMNDLMYIDCICYITKEELRKGLYYRNEDFLLVEYRTSDSNKYYLSLNFGFVSRCKKTEVLEKDLGEIKLLSHEQHICLEFTIVTRYQPGKKIDCKAHILLKLLANIGAHLKQIKAIKSLKDSALCKRVLYPIIEDYTFPITHRNIVHPNMLNFEQRQIVLEAASLCTGSSKGIYCIKGPPGTGKSSVIVNLVFQILTSYYITQETKNPPLILLAAPSNTAVDTLLSKLVAKKYKLPTSEWEKLKMNIKLIRIGPEASLSGDGILYSLTSLAAKHVGTRNKDHPAFIAARESRDDMMQFSKRYFGKNYGQELKICEDIVIKNSTIICTTLNSCVNGKLIDAVNRGLIKFSCCIIDEATQCHEVESLLPVMLGIDKFVLVGDPKQLNATIMNREASNLGYSESLFSRISNNFKNTRRSPIRMLTTQYRMHPEICSFPARQFYDGLLKWRYPMVKPEVKPQRSPRFSMA
ncbi:uncharacterized protein LOC115877189 isoform X2 [Sitophilus oryzae]|uniref:Uncharacterized protein LOC115877189 isoform X2 n=1 Tax=Sitophilus oryzae TaxID=7048 RepID=A0A6J2XD06_SITOR|nr:uncharacterized protein LOC115877189 isoform X2 [Sitophilus oryzae]